MPNEATEVEAGPEQGQGKLTAIEPYYSYDELPKGWIRLLQLVHGPKASYDERERPVYVSMSSFPLDKCPDYVALSYTWGEPTWDLHDQHQVFCQEPRCYPIHCGEKLLLGTRNLRDALRAIRFAQHMYLLRPDIIPDGSDMGGGLYHECCYLWVDSLCIDQGDLRERASQVAQMGAVYTKAKACMIWLGESDTSAHIACEFSARIAKNDRIRNLGGDLMGSTHNLYKLQEEFKRELSSLNNEEAVALAIFYSRRYFSRLWIVQEAILATEAVVMCGSLMMDFDVLLIIAQAFEASNSFSFWTSGCLDAKKKGFSLPFPGSDGSCSETPILLTGIARGRGSSASSKVLDFLAVLAITAKAQATDPRDRIYGILSITRELIRDSLPIIQVDYTLPVENVYTNTTVAIAARTNSLEFLYRVCDRVHYTYSALPSWCPDYSASNRPLLEPSGGTLAGWHTGTLWSSEPQFQFENDTLITYGFRYDTVRGRAIGTNSDASSGIRSDHWRSSRLLSLVADLKWTERPFAKDRPLSRVEMLWRLLMFKKMRGSREAPSAMGFILPALCAALTCMYLKNDESPFNATDSAVLDPELVEDECTALEEVVRSLVELEPESALFLPQRSFKTRPLITDSDALVWYIEELRTINARCKKAGLEKDLHNLVPTSTTTFKDSTTLSVVEKYFFDRISNLLGQTLVAQSVFSTERTERLGLGPRRLRVGDEIWYLQGAPGPCLLRPLKNGIYEFAGMVYIEGLMFGEIAEEPENGISTATIISIK